MSRSKEHRTYTKAFKLEAIQTWQTTDKSTSDVEDDLEIAHGLFCKWNRKFKQNGDQACPGQEELTPAQKRVREMERGNEILRQERDILKQAVMLASPSSFSSPKQ
jgi:transposase